MDIASYFNCIPEKDLEGNNYDYEDYLDSITLLGEVQGFSKEEIDKIADKFVDYITNEWKIDSNKEME